MAKSDSKQVEDITLAVLKLYLKGARSHIIVKYCEQTFNIKKTQTYHYIKLAKEENQKRFEAKKAERIAWHLGAREDMYADAVMEKNKKLALEILDSMAKIEGMNNLNIDLTVEPEGTRIIEYVTAPPDEEKLKQEALQEIQNETI